jgi:hypothetical protein
LNNVGIALAPSLCPNADTLLPHRCQHRCPQQRQRSNDRLSPLTSLAPDSIPESW